MKVRFLGAVGVVTGSCSWLKDEERGWSFLVDCGMNFDSGRISDWSKGQWPFDPAELQFVALTHAHLDHCGLIPMLYKRGFRGPVHCTFETAELAKQVLADSAGQPEAGYNYEDVKRIVWCPFKSNLPLAQPRPVATDLFLRAYRSGHIVGAVSLQVLWGPPGQSQRSIVFSGDVGPGSEDHESSPLIRYPWRPAPADFAVLESTYGGLVRTPEQREPQARMAVLQDMMLRTLEQEGTLLLPAFAIGRAQDLLFELHHIVASDPSRFERLKLVLDAPLAARIGPIVAKALGDSEVTGKAGKVRLRWLGKQVFRRLGLDDSEPEDIDAAIAICKQTLTAKHGSSWQGAERGNEVARNWRPLVDTLESAGLQRGVQPQGPTVIICGSADGDKGAAAKWLPVLLADKRNIVASTGFTPVESVMTKLMQLAAAPPSERKRHTGTLEFCRGQTVVRLRDIAASLVRLTGYSAHADQRDLVDWFFYTRDDCEIAVAPTVFIQHGEDQQRQLLAGVLKARASELGRELEVLLPMASSREVWHWLEDDDAKRALDSRMPWPGGMSPSSARCSGLIGAQRG